MLSKEEVIEVIKYCQEHGMTRKDRLKELGIKPWAFYEAKQVYLRDEKRDGACAEGEFIQLTSGRYVPASVTEAEMAAQERMELRRKEAYPVIRLFEKWCEDTYAKVLESSMMGHAISYAYSLIDRLCVYINDGRVNIDNNLIENAIRPLALGRKNWLFCSNDAAAYRVAIVYSLIASCKAADIDPRQWMEHVLVEIPARVKSGQSLDDLLPAAYARRPDIKRWNLPDPE